MGVNYVAKTNLLTLQSQVNLTSRNGVEYPTAARATITKDPHLVVLDHPHLRSGARQCDAEEATLFLASDNTLDRVLARGNVIVKTNGAQPAEARSKELDLIMAQSMTRCRPPFSPETCEPSRANKSTEDGRLRPFSPHPAPNDQTQPTPAQPMEGKAGRVVLEFAETKSFSKQKFSEQESVYRNSRRRPRSFVAISSAQKPSWQCTEDLKLTASGIDFFMANKQSHLDRA